MLQQASHTSPPHGFAGYVLPPPEIEAAVPQPQRIETTVPEGCLLVLFFAFASESLCHSHSFMSSGNLQIDVWRCLDILFEIIEVMLMRRIKKMWARSKNLVKLAFLYKLVQALNEFYVDGISIFR